MDLKPLIIVAGPGGGWMIASIFEAINDIKPEWDIIGFINKAPTEGEMIGQYNMLGDLGKIKHFIGKGYYILYTLHSSLDRKKKKIEQLKGFHIPAAKIPTAIHPLAYVHPSAKIGRGVVIDPFVVIHPYVVIEDYVRIASLTTISHEARVCCYSEINSGVSVAGGVVVKEGSYIGLGASIRQYVVIGSNSIVGMGSVVVEDVEDNVVVVGNPAKKLRDV